MSEESNIRQIREERTNDAGEGHKSRWGRFRERFATARAISIITSLGTGFGLLWLLGFRHDYVPSPANVEWFWLRTLSGFVIVTLIQTWTLVSVTGRGDDFAAAVDKFIALAPVTAFALCEIYWIGADNPLHLSWRHHLIGLCWAMFSVTDFFSTDIINQRLRTRQIGFGPQSV